MGIYQKFVYADGTLYGDASKVGYSAEPLTAVAIGNTDYGYTAVASRASNGALTYTTNTVTRPRVDLSWTNPTGTVYGFRIVRNQDGYSENEEDGIIVLETYSPTVPAVTTASDEMAGVPLIAGQYAYYTVWILLADNTWAIAAHTYCLIPQTHPVVNLDNTVLKSSDLKFVEIFPKVYTTAGQSYLDEVIAPYTDDNGTYHAGSDFYNFFSGMAYTLDETLTYADLLKPDVTRASTNPNTVNLLLNELGLPLEPTLSIQRKKSLIKNAMQIHQRRGTQDGLQLFAKSLTGYNVAVFDSANLLFSPQDSSFYKTTGNWAIGANGVLTANATTGAGDLPYQNEAYSIDRSYTGKVVTSATNVVMSLGANNPRLLGVPVQRGTTYQLTYYIKGATNNVTPSLTWYDMAGNSIATVSGTATAASSTWTKITYSTVAPIASSVIPVTPVAVVVPTQTPTIVSGVVTLTTSTAHGLNAGDYVTIANVTPTGYRGTYQVTAVPSTTSFSYTNATTGAVTVAGTAQYAPGNGTTVTMPTSTPHGLFVGQYVSVFGVTPSGYNGTVQVTSTPTPNSFVYTNATTGPVTVAGNVGTVGISTATTGAWFAGINLTFAAAGTYYVDMVQFARASDARNSSYYEARTVEYNLLPNKINYFENPSLSSATNWTTTGAMASYITSTVPGVKQDGSNMTSLATTSGNAFSFVGKSSTTIQDGQFYVFSIYAATAANTETISFKVEAYDLYDNLLNTDIVGTAVRSLNNQVVGTTWKRYTIPIFIPFQSSGVYVKATVSSTSANGNAVYLDAAQLEPGYTATDYFDGSYTSRGASWLSSTRTNLATNPSFEASSSTFGIRVNLVANPSFETSTAGWAVANSATIATSTAQKYVGTQSLLVTYGASPGTTYTGAGFAVSLSASTTYTFSAWVYTPTGSVLPQLSVQAGGGFTTVISSNATTFNTWERISVTFTTTTAQTYTLYVLNGATVTAGKTIYVDSVLLEAGSQLNTYFDGSTTASGDFTYGWTSTTNLSTSVQIANIVDGWSNVFNPGGLAYGLYQTSNSSLSGTKSMALSMFQGTGATQFNIGTPNLSAIIAGKTYTMSCYVYSSRTQVLSLLFTVNSTSGGTTYPGAGFTVTGGTWTRLNYTYTMPSDLTSAAVQIVGSPSVGDYFYFDQFLLEESSSLGTYFDGSTTTISGVTTKWNGTANASTSTATGGAANNSVSIAYRSKAVKLDRLAVEAVNQMALNSSFVITTGLNGSKTVETSGWAS